MGYTCASLEKAGHGGRPLFLNVIKCWAVLFILSVTGCQSPSSSPSLQRFEFASAHMGTQFHLTLYAPDQTAAELAAKAAFHAITALEEIISDYQADSELNWLCQQPFGRPVRVSAELFDVLDRAKRIAQLTDGAFDPTIGPYVRLWRFSRKRKVLPTSAELAIAAAAVGYQKLELNRNQRSVTLLAPNMRLDLGGIGKGYAADQAMRLLKGRGLGRALMAASGDIAIGDAPPGRTGWKIAVASLNSSTNRPARTVLLRNAGVSTSGDIEQAINIDGVRYSHIVSPTTGLGLTNRVQVTVVAPDATRSDALATAVSILGPQRGVTLINSLPKTGALILVERGGQKRTLFSHRFDKLAPEAMHGHSPDQ
jgi:FAD:protein FMN transferase